MNRAKWIACLPVMLIASCATNGPATPEPTVLDTGCSWVKPIYIGKDDKLTDETARQILAHNRTWSSVCNKSAAGTPAPVAAPAAKPAASAASATKK